MAVTHVGTTLDESTDNPTPSTPSGTTGDMLLAINGCYGIEDEAPYITNSTTQTAFPDRLVSLATDYVQIDQGSTIEVLLRTTNGSEAGSYNLDCSDATNYLQMGVLTRITSSQLQSTSGGIYTNVTGGGNAELDIPAHTVDTDGSLVVIVALGYDQAITNSAFTGQGYTSRASFDDGWGRIYTKEVNAGSVSVVSNIQAGSDDYGALVLLIFEPAAAGNPTGSGTPTDVRDTASGTAKGWRTASGTPTDVRDTASGSATFSSGVALTFANGITMTASASDPHTVDCSPNPSTDDVLVLIVGQSQSGGYPPVATLGSDSYGGTWTEEFSSYYAGRRRNQVYVNDNFTTVSGTVDVLFDNSQDRAVALVVVSGVDKEATYADATITDSSGSNWTPTLTAGASDDGHLVVIQMESTGTISTPSGWTKLGQVTASDGLRSLAVFYAVGTLSDTTPTFSWTGTEGFLGWSAHFVGAAAGNPTASGTPTDVRDTASGSATFSSGVALTRTLVGSSTSLCNTTPSDSHDGTFNCGTLTAGDLVVVACAGTIQEPLIAWHPVWTTPSKSSGTATIGTVTEIGEAWVGADYSVQVRVWHFAVTGTGTLVLNYGDSDETYGPGIIVLKYTGHDATTPIAGAIAPTVTNPPLATTGTLGATPVAADEVVQFTNWDTDAGSGKNTTPGANFTERADIGATSDYVMFACSTRTGTTSTTQTWNTENATPTTYSCGGVMFIVKAAAAGNPTGSGTPTDVRDTASGTAKGWRTASGTPTDVRDTATGSALSEPQSNASGTPTDVRDTASGSATFSSGVSASGTPTDVRDTAAGSAAFTSTASGAVTDVRDTATGTALSEPQSIASGTPTDVRDTATGSATSVVPTSSASGAVTDVRDTATGTALSEPQSNASGTPTDVRDTGTGSATFVGVNPTGSGTPTDVRDTASGSAVRWATASGAATDVRDTATGAASIPSVPVVASYTENNTTTAETSFVLTKPAGVTTGDLLMLIVGLDDSNTQVDSIDTPSGWTQQSQLGDGSNDIRQAIFTRVATGSEGATETVTMTGTADFWAGFYLRITGADVASIIIGSADYTTSAATITSPTVTTTDADSLVIAVASGDGSDTGPFTVSGTGWPSTLPSGQDSVSAGQTSVGAHVAFLTREVGTPGAANTLTWTLGSTDGANGVAIVLPPSGPDVPTASGAVTDVRDTASGSATSVVPTFNASGTPTDERDTATGSAAATGLTYTGSGTPTDERDTASGAGIRWSLASGSPTDERDTAVGRQSVEPQREGGGGGAFAVGSPGRYRDLLTIENDDDEVLEILGHVLQRHWVAYWRQTQSNR